MDPQTFIEKLFVPLALAFGQLWLNAQFRRADEKRDAARADTDAKRRAEAEWRDGMERRMDSQDARINAVLAAQCTQMRSDLIHKAHRYIDDLGCAGVEEKQAYWAEYEDYVSICAAHDIVNHFVDQLSQKVMELPDRQEKS